MSDEIKQNLKDVAISKVTPNTWNYNEQSDEILEKTKANIKEVGFVKPITVRSKDNGYEIINGYHRWLACKELKFKTIAVNDLGEVDDKKAQMLTILLNELKGTPNPVKLGKIIEGVYSSSQWEDLAHLFPYNDEEMDNFRKIAEDALKSMAEEKKDEAKDDVVYTLVVTKDQSDIINRALALFDEDVSEGERFHEICIRFIGKQG